MFNSPSGLAVDATDNCMLIKFFNFPLITIVYICDTENHVIRKMDQYGVITTIAGISTFLGKFQKI